MCILWITGLMKGDGYIDDRHVEIYNSSEEILKKSVSCLKSLCDEKRIKVDIYTNKPDVTLIDRWSSTLAIDKENMRIRENTSPWKARTEKIRLRVASKALSDKLRTVKINDTSPFLKGLFDAEASVDIKGYIEFKQKADKKGTGLVEQVHNLLKSMGIRTTDPRTKKDNTNRKSDRYIYVKDLEKFKENIGFTCHEKRKKLDILLKVRSKGNRSKSLPMKNATLWEMMEMTCSPYHKLRRMHSNLAV